MSDTPRQTPEEIERETRALGGGDLAVRLNIEKSALDAQSAKNADVRETPFRIGQLWMDQEGLRWRIVMARDEWVWVRRHGYPHSNAIQTLTAWLRVWTPLD